MEIDLTRQDEVLPARSSGRNLRAALGLTMATFLIGGVLIFAAEARANSKVDVCQFADATRTSRVMVQITRRQLYQELAAAAKKPVTVDLVSALAMYNYPSCGIYSYRPDVSNPSSFSKR